MGKGGGGKRKRGRSVGDTERDEENRDKREVEVS